jgi:hypothetical protein
MSIAYLADPDVYVGTKIFSPMPSDKKSDLYWKYTRESFFRSEMQKRGPGDESVGTGYGLTLGQYNCDVFALHHDISDQERSNADSPLNVDSDTTIFLTQQGLIKLDQQWAANFFTTGIWTGGLKANAANGDLIGGTDFTKWSIANSTPIEDIRKQVINLALTGVAIKDMVLVLGVGVWQVLADHPEIINRLKITEEKVLTTGLLAALWGIKDVVVPMSVVNTANEGGAPVYQYIHGNNALLAYVQPAPGIRKPAAGYTFFWKDYLGGQGISEIQKFRMQERKSDRVEIEMAFDQQVVAPDLAAFFSVAV